MGFVLFLKFVARNDPVTLKYYHEITDHEYVLPQIAIEKIALFREICYKLIVVYRWQAYVMDTL